MGIYTDKIRDHHKLDARMEESKKRLTKLKKRILEDEDFFKDKAVSIYCAGSIGRGDVGSHSDLDLFILTTKNDAERSNLTDVELLAKIININRDLGYQALSNDGQYLKVYSISTMLKALGAPQDDSENLFTARMLLLLEGCCAYNDELYKESIRDIVQHYFRDRRGKKAFRPLFLLNDLLRFWRTLCLNYELIRDEQKPWIKKNINLKFSRMLTVFGTVLPLISEPIKDVERVINLTSKTPLQRFAIGLDALSDDSLLSDFDRFLDSYETFIETKEKIGSSIDYRPNEDLVNEMRTSARNFSEFIYMALNNKNIDFELKKYLVL